MGLSSCSGEEDGIEEQSAPDYLFHPKPPEQQQQTPDEDRLVGYYWSISREAHDRGILLDGGTDLCPPIFRKGKLLGKIPVYHGSMVESILNVCKKNRT